jgi:hypothetical protein
LSIVHTDRSKKVKIILSLIFFPPNTQLQDILKLGAAERGGAGKGRGREGEGQRAKQQSTRENTALVLGFP